MKPQNVFLSSPPFGSRPYALLRHADSLIAADDSTREQRSDALVNLRRALDVRSRDLIEAYNLTQVPVRDKPRGQLELLEFFDLIRPRMVSNLISIRNSIEHEDEPPPDLERVRELSEFMWYFLRSTDTQVKPGEKIDFDSPYLEDEEPKHSWTAPPYRITLSVAPKSPKPWNMTIEGYVPRFALLEKSKEGYMVLDCEVIETREERTSSVKERDAQIAGEDDLYLNAQIRGNSDHIIHLVKRYVLCG